MNILGEHEINTSSTIYRSKNLIRLQAKLIDIKNGHNYIN